jgi:hypothetical protein
METVIENEVICENCGDDLVVTEDGISECATCAWFAATFQKESIDVVAEQIRVDELNESWAQDAAKFCEVH